MCTRPSSGLEFSLYIGALITRSSQLKQREGKREYEIIRGRERVRKRERETALYSYPSPFKSTAAIEYPNVSPSWMVWRMIKWMLGECTNDWVSVQMIGWVYNWLGDSTNDWVSIQMIGWVYNWLGEYTVSIQMIGWVYKYKWLGEYTNTNDWVSIQMIGWVYKWLGEYTNDWVSIQMIGWVYKW